MAQSIFSEVLRTVDSNMIAVQFVVPHTMIFGGWQSLDCGPNKEVLGIGCVGVSLVQHRQLGKHPYKGWCSFRWY